MKKLFISVIFCVSLASTVFSLDIGGHPLDITVLGGTTLLGEIQGAWFDDFDPKYTFTFTNDNAWFGRIGADFFPVKFVGFGVTADLAALNLKEDLRIISGSVTNFFPKSGITMLEFDAYVKGRFEIENWLVIKPAIGMGYRHTFCASPDAVENGFGVEGNIQALFPLTGTFSLCAEIGFFSQPYGGIVDVAFVRAGPVLYIAVGLAI